MKIIHLHKISGLLCNKVSGTQVNESYQFIAVTVINVVSLLYSLGEYGQLWPNVLVFGSASCFGMMVNIRRDITL